MAAFPKGRERAFGQEGFRNRNLARKPPRESKTRKHITGVEAVRQQARMSWAWDFMVGCVHWMQSNYSSIQEGLYVSAAISKYQEADKNGEWIHGWGRLAGPTPGGRRPPTSWKSKNERGVQLRPPAQRVAKQIQRQPPQLLLLAEAHGQRTGPVIACPQKEEDSFSAPRAPKRCRGRGRSGSRGGRARGRALEVSGALAGPGRAARRISGASRRLGRSAPDGGLGAGASQD